MRKIDYTNKKFGFLKVRGMTDKGWECVCDCGEVVYYTSRQLQTNKPRSCGCLRSENLTNKVFGRLKVLYRTGKSDDNGNAYWMCECQNDGNIKEVTSHDLNCGTVKSCGCLFDDALVKTGKQIGEYVIKNHVIEGTNIKNLTMSKRKDNSSGIKGVTFDNSRGKWIAQIRFKGRNYHLGRYSDINEAAKAREKAEEKIFGEFLEWYQGEFLLRENKGEE